MKKLRFNIPFLVVSVAFMAALFLVKAYIVDAGVEVQEVTTETVVTEEPDNNCTVVGIVYNSNGVDVDRVYRCEFDDDVCYVTLREGELVCYFAPVEKDK